MHAVVRDVVAFANTNGGTIWVGVSPKAKVAPKGIDNPEEGIKELAHRDRAPGDAATGGRCAHP